MRGRFALSFGLLSFLCLACGLGATPCSEARPERARALATYRASVGADLARAEERWRTASPGIRRLGADSVLSQSIRRQERILGYIGPVEDAWESGDEATGALALDDLDYLSSTRSDWAPVQAAAREATRCTE